MKLIHLFKAQNDILIDYKQLQGEYEDFKKKEKDKVKISLQKIYPFIPLISSPVEFKGNYLEHEGVFLFTYKYYNYFLLENKTFVAILDNRRRPQDSKIENNISIEDIIERRGFEVLNNIYEAIFNLFNEAQKHIDSTSITPLTQNVRQEESRPKPYENQNENRSNSHSNNEQRVSPIRDNDSSRRDSINERTDKKSYDNNRQSNRGARPSDSNEQRNNNQNKRNGRDNSNNRNQDIQSKSQPNNKTDNARPNISEKKDEDRRENLSDKTKNVPTLTVSENNSSSIQDIKEKIDNGNTITDQNVLDVISLPKNTSSENVGLVDDTVTAPAKEEVTKPVEVTATKPVETEATKAVEVTAIKPVETEATKPVEVTTTKPVETEVTKAVEVTTTKPVETEVTKAVEVTTTKPVEEEATKAVEVTTTKPVEEEATKAVEVITTKPVEEEATKNAIEEILIEPVIENKEKIIEIKEIENVPPILINKNPTDVVKLESITKSGNELDGIIVDIDELSQFQSDKKQEFMLPNNLMAKKNNDQYTLDISTFELDLETDTLTAEEQILKDIGTLDINEHSQESLDFIVQDKNLNTNKIVVDLTQSEENSSETIVEANETITLEVMETNQNEYSIKEEEHDNIDELLQNENLNNENIEEANNWGEEEEVIYADYNSEEDEEIDYDSINENFNLEEDFDPTYQIEEDEDFKL